MQSFIPLTCGCGGRANVVDEVGRVAVTASEVVPRPVPLVALSCCCCRFLAFRCFLRDVFLLSLQRTRTNSAKFSWRINAFLQVPKCFGLVQIFCARPKIYSHIVAVTNILCQTKRWFAFSIIGFCATTKVFEEALNAVKFLGWLKKFGPAQNILGPVKGQVITH